MELITRDEARAKGLIHFYTGKPCRNNHVAKRYVIGGACYDCLYGEKIFTEAHTEQRLRIAAQKAKTEALRAELAKRRLELNLSKEAAKKDRDIFRGLRVTVLNELTKMGVEIPETDLPAMRAYVLSLAMARIPGVRPQDINANVLPKYRSGICYFYYFMVHPLDKQAVRDYAQLLMEPHTLTPQQVAEARDRRLASLRTQMDAEEDNGAPPPLTAGIIT